MSVVRREVVQTAFDPGTDALVAVLEEELDSGVVFRQRRPEPRIVLTVSRHEILADGQDVAEVTATFEQWELQAQEEGPPVGVWLPAAPVGDVEFSVNLRPVMVPVVGGQAVLSLDTTVPGRYVIRATLPGYVGETVQVEAMA